jgi:hypothetical protein
MHMKTMKTRIVLFAAALSASAALLGACQDQPNAGCPVSTSNPSFGNYPYWVKYEKVTSTGACGDLKGEAWGFQKYNVPGTTDVRLGYAIEGLGAPYHAERPQRDPNDPLGKNINGFADLPLIPNAEDFCVATNFAGPPTDGGNLDAPQQRYEMLPEIRTPLADGGEDVQPVVPEQFVKYEVQDLKFLATVNAPGTIFTGQVKVTQDTCTATFNTFGLWPQIECDPAKSEADGYNVDCDPLERPDAGHITGSGINPSFAPSGKPVICGSEHFCEIQLSAEEVAKL